MSQVVIKSSFEKIYQEKEESDIDKYFPYYLDYMKTPGRVLDIGCGTGKLVNHLRSLGVHCYGVDVSKVAIKKARKPYILLGGATHIPFRNATFDVTGCHWVLEHVDDIDGVLKEMVRVTKHNGKIVLYTANCASLVRPHTIILYLVNKRKYVYSGSYSTIFGVINASRPVLTYVEMLLKTENCKIVKKLTCQPGAKSIKRKLIYFFLNIPIIRNWGYLLFIVAEKASRTRTRVLSAH